MRTGEAVSLWLREGGMDARGEVTPFAGLWERYQAWRVAWMEARMVGRKWTEARPEDRIEMVGKKGFAQALESAGLEKVRLTGGTRAYVMGSGGRGAVSRTKVVVLGPEVATMLNGLRGTTPANRYVAELIREKARDG